LELSSEAFLALSKRFKANTKEWLKADKAAQRTRNKKPEAMDIYDTSKGKGKKMSSSDVVHQFL
jgi:hypothetical protein